MRCIHRPGEHKHVRHVVRCFSQILSTAPSSAFFAHCVEHARHCWPAVLSVDKTCDRVQRVGPQEQMTPLQRTSAVALVTAEVHNRDVLEALIGKEVSDPQNFLWQAQLRCVRERDSFIVNLMRLNMFAL